MGKIERDLRLWAGFGYGVIRSLILHSVCESEASCSFFCIGQKFRCDMEARLWSATAYVGFCQIVFCDKESIVSYMTKKLSILQS